MAMIGLAVYFLRLVDLGTSLGPATASKPVRALAWSTFAAGWLVLYVGTIVTGAGPHAGDQKAPRNGLDPQEAAQLHADLVFLFVGLTIGLIFLLALSGANQAARKAATLLLAVEIGQGAIGFVQYFTHVPEVLVGFHMLGAALISATMTWMLLTTRDN
jgi:cytochrome c oxidase assembly protein subunit 15